MAENKDEKPRVTGLGGIFFKCKDSKATKQWYSDNLGLNTDEYGTSFEWRTSDNPEIKGYTVWSPFAETSKYFEPSQKDYMINYRVNNLKGLLEELKKKGVTVIEKIEEVEYGKFGWIIDPEGNKVELWEPIHEKYTEMVEGKTTK